MTNRVLIAILIAATLLMIPLLAPMRLLVSALPVSNAAGMTGVTGTVWAGRLENVTLAGAPVGTWKAGLDPLPLVDGQIRVVMKQDKAGADQSAVLLLGQRDKGVARLNLRTSVDLSGVGLPLEGDVAFRDVTAAFRRGRCAGARGDIRLRLNGEGPLQGSVLNGVSACRGESWAATLTGRSRGADLTLTMRIDETGRYQLEMMVATTDVDLIQGLLASGFAKDAVGARRTSDGRLFSPSKVSVDQSVQRAP